MTRPSDETLMAFADGALAPDEQERIAALIESDPEARALVELYRRSATAVRGAYDEPLAAPLPVGVVDLILGQPEAAASVKEASRSGPQGAKVVPLPPRRPRAHGVQDYAVPLAAGLALAVGLATGWSLFGGRVPVPAADSVALGVGGVPPGSLLASLLETRPSHAPVEARFDGRPHRLAIVATFKDASGRHCREVELARPDDSGQVVGLAVACRGGAGAWTVEGAARVADGPASAAVKPASGQKVGPIDGILAGLGATTPLSRDDETAAIDRRWR